MNDRSNTRGIGGLNLHRRTSSSRPIKLEHTCTMYFMISYDKNGFFIVNGHGNRHHCYHPYIESSSQIYPSKLIPSLEKDISKSINLATPNVGVSRNVIYERTNIILSLQNIRYLNKHLMKNDVSEHSTIVKASSADRVIDYFRENNIDFSCLLHGLDENGCFPKIFTENVTFSHTRNTKDNVSNIPDFIHSLSKKYKKRLTFLLKKTVIA